MACRVNMSNLDPQLGGPPISGAYQSPPYMIIQPNTSVGGQYGSNVQYVSAPMSYSQYQARHFSQQGQWQPQQQVVHVPVNNSNGQLSAVSISGYNLPVNNRFQVLDNNNDFPSLPAESDEDMLSVNPMLAEGIIDSSEDGKIRFPSLGLNPSLGRKRVRSPGVSTQSKNKKQEMESAVTKHCDIPVNELFLTRVEFEVIDKNQKLADEFSILKSLKECVSPIRFEFESNRERNMLSVYVNTIEEAEKVQEIQSIGGVKVKAQKKECTRRGIIKGVPLYLSDEQLKECIESSVQITEAIRQKRYNRESRKLEDSYAVMVVFSSNYLPPIVWCCGRKKEVFVYNRRILQCFKCQRYGHLQKNCKANEPVCLRCSGKHESVNCPLKNSDSTEKVQTYRCANCKGCHSSTSRECPIRQQNRNVLLMAEKYNMGYKRAQVVYRTYAQAACKESLSHSSLSQKSKYNTSAADILIPIVSALAITPEIFQIQDSSINSRIDHLCTVIQTLTSVKLDSLKIKGAILNSHNNEQNN